MKMSVLIHGTGMIHGTRFIRGTLNTFERLAKISQMLLILSVQILYFWVFNKTQYLMYFIKWFVFIQMCQLTPQHSSLLWATSHSELRPAVALKPLGPNRSVHITKSVNTRTEKKTSLGTAVVRACRNREKGECVHQSKADRSCRDTFRSRNTIQERDRAFHFEKLN